MAARTTYRHNRRIDPEIDLAVLRISTSTKLPAISFADNTPPAPGDIVFAVGNPFGLNNSASMGIISAVKRNKLGINRPGQEQFIQTDAAINPGSSGGALANTDGELVGINTALFSRRRSGDSPQGISFAVPVAAIHRFLSCTDTNRVAGRRQYLWRRSAPFAFSSAC